MVIKNNSALRAYVLIARYYHIKLSVDNLQREHEVGDDEISIEKLASIINENESIKAKASFIKWETFIRAGSVFPLLARLKNGNYVVIGGVKEESEGTKKKLFILIQDPLAESLDILKIPEEEFLLKWNKEIILIQRKEDSWAAEKPFGFGWLWDEIAKQKGLFWEVGVASIYLHILAFVTPFFAMVVFDKVIGYQGYSTLHVLFIAALCSFVIAGLIGIVRNLLILNATIPLDMELSHLISRRIMGLPLSFFNGIPKGVIIKKVQEASSIRDFMTGNLLFTIIDASIIFIIFPVLFLFNKDLTFIVIIFCTFLAINLLVVIKTYRLYIQNLYTAEAERQSVFVETINGIETIKSMAIEKKERDRWLEATSKVINCELKVGKLGGYINEISEFLQKAMSVTIVWQGAQLVLSGDMSVGTLIAYNIMAGRISAPLVQLVALASKYQEVVVSVEMLKNIVNRPPEKLRGGGLTPLIKGNIEMENVTFSYHPDIRPALKNISFNIRKGEKIGVVGPSGSGKSTLTRLLQGFYYPNKGYLRIDGYDIREFDIYYFRSRLGVILQDNFLFSASIKENIAKARPDKSLDEIINVSRMTGAHEFIETFIKSYDTVLEENASNLSGGQKQRIVFARALMDNPNILIMDEATSALDMESERKILSKLNEIGKNRTLINITHRLTSMKDMDRIIVLDNGEIVDIASHDVLLKKCSLYSHLWHQQFSGDSLLSLDKE